MRSMITPIFDWLRRDFPLKIFLLLIFVYFVIRAHLLSITHDEALTILSITNKSFLDILLFKTPHPANNHLLNSLSVLIFC